MTVEEFILTKATYMSTMTYDKERYGWDIPDLPTKTPGIYFIVRGGEHRVSLGKSKLDILKVGKAEGKYGLRGRMQSYTSTSVNRKDWDRTIQYVHNAMHSLLDKKGNHCDLHLYCLEMPMSKVLFEGYELEASIIRSLEKTLSIKASSEGPSMLLSGQD